MPLMIVWVLYTVEAVVNHRRVYRRRLKTGGLLEDLEKLFCGYRPWFGIQMDTPCGVDSRMQFDGCGVRGEGLRDLQRVPHGFEKRRIELILLHINKLRRFD